MYIKYIHFYIYSCPIYIHIYRYIKYIHFYIYSCPIYRNGYILYTHIFRCTSTSIMKMLFSFFMKHIYILVHTYMITNACVTKFYIQCEYYLVCILGSSIWALLYGKAFVLKIKPWKLSNNILNMIWLCSYSNYVVSFVFPSKIYWKEYKVSHDRYSSRLPLFV